MLIKEILEEVVNIKEDSSKNLVTKSLRLKESVGNYEKFEELKIGLDRRGDLESFENFASFTRENLGKDSSGLEALNYLDLFLRRNRNFLNDKSLDILEKYRLYGLIASLGIGPEYPNLDYNKAYNIVSNLKKIEYKDILNMWPKDIKSSKEEVANMKNNSSKNLETKKLKLKEGKDNTMNTFRSFLEEKEEKQIELEINEDVASFIGKALGFVTGATAIAFGGTLLALGGLKAAKGLQTLFGKVKAAFKSLRKPNDIMKNLRTDPAVVKAKQQIEVKKREFQDQLGTVYSAIDAKDYEKAREEFTKVEKSVQNMPDVHKAIIAELTKSFKEPPIYVTSPGNKTYQMVKKIINIRVARAAAKATEMAFNKASGGAEEEKIQVSKDTIS